ncbi:MAG: hypothetical protein A2133_10515 [Actinobacteria bacterium RBG_16_64_13]|nr:MAG: hypothetical protein A2133_10515 [Actinobacteria bacterium RBG_16_64_13]
MTGMLSASTSSRHLRSGPWGTALRLVAVVVLAAALVVSLDFPGGIRAALAEDDGPPGSAAPGQDAGDPQTFWALDWATGTYVQIHASAEYIGDHAIIYVGDSGWLSPYSINELGTIFDTSVYPALTEAYGSEPNPGMDGDPRIAILIYDFNDPKNDIDASFNPNDINPNGSPYSNQSEMFYLNLRALLAGPGQGPVLAAHEFAHLIVHYRDLMLDPSPYSSVESPWLVEGFATYGEHLAGYDERAGSQLSAFTRDPGVGLTNWLGLRANYGAAYSFMRYLADREGPAFVRALIDQPLDGEAGVDATLAGVSSAYSFASLFDDWVVAGFLDERPPQLWPYFFSDLSVSAQPWTLTGAFPAQGSAAVVNYGAVYLDFPATLPSAIFQAVVDGADGAPLHAALVSWDSAGAVSPSLTRFDLANAATGSTVTAPAGYDRHTLIVWARGLVWSVASYSFTYSGSPDPPGGVQFLDMGGGDPFYEYVAALLSREIISGKEVPSGSGLWFFMGKDNVLRAQFAKMIMQATGLHTTEVDNLGDPTFKDVPSVYNEHGYPYDYIEEAAALGIVTGYKNGTFSPYNPITRSQLVLMITRGAAAAGKPLPVYTGSAKVFADVPLSHLYYRQIMAAYSAGILSGSPGGDGRLYFHPYSPASRNHVAKMTAKLLEYLEMP